MIRLFGSVILLACLPVLAAGILVLGGVMVLQEMPEAYMPYCAALGITGGVLLIRWKDRGVK